MDSLVGLDEVAVLEEIDLVNDMDQDWIDDRSEPELEFEPERNRLMGKNYRTCGCSNGSMICQQIQKRRS